jgi:hypothetical protein
VLTFTTVGRMLILPSQLGSPLPEVLYVGIRPNPSFTPLNSSATKDVNVTFSYGVSFDESPMAVLHWGVGLALLVLSFCIALVIGTLFFRSGVKKVQAGGDANAPNSSDSLNLGMLSARRQEELWTRNRAKSYLWMVALGGIFYLLPSLQTSSSEAAGMLTSGNRDACFYNDLCMFPLQTRGPYAVTWWAANNILSNVGYVIVGILLFGWIMLCKRYFKGRRTLFHILELPHDYTLMYCLAISILYEGFMSATYHVCPNRLIFTVDTAFMFVGSIIMALEVYRKWFRALPHPFLPFILLSSLLIFNYFGTLLDLYEYDHGAGQTDIWQVALWAVMFTALWDGALIVIAIRHRHRIHKAVLAICLTIACVLGCLPLASIANVNFMDRSTMLLGVALGTGLLIVFAFVLGTLPRVDWVTRISRIIMVIAVLGAAIPALLYFNASPSNKALPPWMSRELAQPCTFYDDHDMWHFLSSLGLGLTLLMLMHCGESVGREIVSRDMDFSISDPQTKKEKSDRESNETTPLL